MEKLGRKPSIVAHSNGQLSDVKYRTQSKKSSCDDDVDTCGSVEML